MRGARKALMIGIAVAVLSLLPGGIALASPPSIPGIIDRVVPAPPGDLRAMVMPRASGDAFFDASPRGSGPHGQLLSSRVINTLANIQVGLNSKEVRQIKFRTTDSHGVPTFGTATVVIPKGPLAGKGILVNNVPINSLGRDCTPGYKLAHGQVDSSQFAPPISALGNAAGYVVVIPDHEGPTMAYGEPIAGGHVVLDALLALRSAYPVLADSRFVMRGYSGGSIPTYGATTLMRTYAPSLVPQYRGASLGGTPINQRMLTQSMPGALNWAKGLFWAGVVGIARQNPSLLPYANNAVRWLAKSPLKDMCSEVLTPLGVLPIPPELVANVANPFEIPAARALYARLDLNHRASAGPLYIYNGAQEFWIQAGAAQKFARDQRALGVPVTYVPVLGEHITGELLGFGPASAWLKRQLDS